MDINDVNKNTHAEWALYELNTCLLIVDKILDAEAAYEVDRLYKEVWKRLKVLRAYFDDYVKELKELEAKVI